MNWLSLDDAEALFFASSDEILNFVADGTIETKSMVRDGHNYLYVLEIHMDRNFHRRDPSKKLGTIKKDLLVGAAGGVSAAAIYDALKSATKALAPVETDGNQQFESKIENWPEDSFPRSSFLEQKIGAIASKSNLRVRQLLLSAFEESLTYQQFGPDPVALNLYSNSSLSLAVLVEHKVVISRQDFESFLLSFGWKQIPLTVAAPSETWGFAGLMHDRTEHFSYVEWLATIDGLMGSRDVHTRLDYHISLIRYFLQNMR